MLIAVAIAAVAIWLNKLSRGYREKADDYRYSAAVQTLANTMSERRRQRFEYFLQMADKYDRAARYPFLPVAPDPPQPE